MNIALRWARRAALGLAALVCLTFAWIVLGVAASLPQTAGTRSAEGLSAPARIVRDAHGGAHIFAASDHDAYFALGYAHAQDRFFQMDMTRRVMAGRLSELIGPAGLRLDARARIKGFNGVIAAQTAHLSPAARAMLTAYADGVNARLAQGAASPEHVFLFAKPELWRVEDSVAVAVALTDELVVGDLEDFARARLAKRLSPVQLDEFFPAYPDWAPRSLDEEAKSASKTGARAASGPVPGSNAWVLSGARTASGKPLLATDPHLSFSAPGPFYLARLALGSGPRIGLTAPGAPLVVIGRNASLAWGLTDNEIDAADLIAAPPGGFAGITTHEERISVRQLIGPARTVAIDVRANPDGPILDPDWFNLKPFANKDVMLRDIALDRDNQVIDALLEMTGARTVDAFITAQAGWTAPLQHIHVASTDGDIALVSTGDPPLRDKDGRWIGRIPRSARPIAKNPARGFFATANNLATPSSFPYEVRGQFAVHRVARIYELLKDARGVDLNALAAMQRDEVSAFAARVLAPLLAGARPRTKAGRAALATLRGWDGAMVEARPEPLIFAAWINALSGALYRDELGEQLAGDFPGPRNAFLDWVLTGKGETWCDVVTTAPIETCASAISGALDEAALDLTRTYGADPTRWRWARAHRARFAHPLLSGLPIIGDAFTVLTPIGGDGDTINAASYLNGGDYTAVHGRAAIAAFDLSDLNRSRFILAPGQSGNPFSPRYRDLAGDWAQSRGFEVRDDWTWAAPPEGARVLSLVPRQGSAPD